MSGSGASNARTNKIHSLLVACTGDEAKYLVRGLNGTLRVGQYLSTSLFSSRCCWFDVDTYHGAFTLAIDRHAS